MADPPNLVFIFTDQQRADTLPQYGNEIIEAPNLGSLGRDSTVFLNAYCTKPVCSPSRSALMTGKYPHATGVYQNNVPLPPDAMCLPELGHFEEYTSCYVGKWHLGNETEAQHGFEEWVSTAGYGGTSDYDEYLSEVGYDSGEIRERQLESHSQPAFIADNAIEFIEKQGDDPFVLYMNFTAPHPLFTSVRDDQYDPSDVELPPNFDYDGLTEQIDRVRFAQRAVKDPDMPITTTFNRLGNPPTEEVWRTVISNYYGMVSLVDTHVGRVLDTLSEHGLAGETITVFTSDHGEMMGSQQLVGKMQMFEESIKVPLFVRVPDAERNADTVETPVSQIDLVPTLLDAMGQPVPDGLHGHSWLPFLGDEGDLVEQNVFVEMDNGPYRGIDSISNTHEPTVPTPTAEAQALWGSMETGRNLVCVATDPTRTVITPDGWKLNYRRSGDHELYDLDADPHETRNVADQHTERIEELYGTINEWRVRTHDPVPL